MAKTKILLVDDEAVLLESLSHILAMHGFKVTTAGTVADALKQIRSPEFRRAAERRPAHAWCRRWSHRRQRHASRQSPAGYDVAQCVSTDDSSRSRHHAADG